jgi:hypothetical protein
MEDDPTSQNVVKYRPDPRKLEKRVRELALDSKNVRWRSSNYDTHAESQMDFRDISDKMMFEVLRSGFIKGEIVAGKYSGEWKIKMCKAMKGQREVGVVTILVRDQSLFVKTVEWEDIR